MLKNKELKDITVLEICDRASITRSTFYERYADISALSDSYAAKIERQIERQPHTDGEFAWIFEYIRANKDAFEIYFRLGISSRATDYKTLFFRNGVYAIAKMWFEGGCAESAEDMATIVCREYKKLF